MDPDDSTSSFHGRNVACVMKLSLVCVLKWSEVKWSHSVMSDSLRPHGLWPTRLLRPWDFPGKSYGVGCHVFLLCVCSVQSLSCVRLFATPWLAARQASLSITNSRISLRLILPAFSNGTWCLWGKEVYLASTPGSILLHRSSLDANWYP